MEKRILVILGHPSTGSTYCRALWAAYSEAAKAAGHAVRRLDVSSLEFPWIRDKQQFHEETPPPAILAGQQDLAWAQHVVIVYPLWLGLPPAHFKAFLEQLLRPGFAHVAKEGGLPKGALRGKSARLFVTMGMPAPAYRWFFLAHGHRALKRNVLAFCGIGPIRDCFIGGVEAKDPARRGRWLAKAAELGRDGG